MFCISAMKAIVAATSLTAISSAFAADSATTPASGSDVSLQYSSLDTGAQTTEDLGPLSTASTFSTSATMSSVVGYGNSSSTLTSSASTPPPAPVVMTAHSDATLLLPSPGKTYNTGANQVISTTSVPALQNNGPTDTPAPVETVSSTIIIAASPSSGQPGVVEVEGSTLTAGASAGNGGGQVGTTYRDTTVDIAATGAPGAESTNTVPSQAGTTSGTAEPSLQTNDAALSRAVAVTSLVGIGMVVTWLRHVS